MFRKFAAAAVCCVSFGTAAHAVPSFSFIIDGDTFTQPFSFSNTSTGGENLLRFFIDLTGTGKVFDTVTGGVPNTTIGVPFTPRSGSDITTGLTGNTVVDGGSTLNITFNDFQPTETFIFDIDVDDADPLGSATVLGNELIGATAFADFSDGQRVSGIFAAIPGRPEASGFSATGITVTPPIPLPAPALLLFGGLGLLAALRKRA